ADPAPWERIKARGTSRTFSEASRRSASLRGISRMASKRVAGFRLFRGPTWMYMRFGGRGFRHIASAARGVLAIGLVACAFGAGHVAVAQEAVEAPRHVLRLYSGPCNADDPLPQAGAESASPQVVPATPYQAAVFAMEIE